MPDPCHIDIDPVHHTGTFPRCLALAKQRYSGPRFGLDASSGRRNVSAQLHTACLLAEVRPRSSDSVCVRHHDDDAVLLRVQRFASRRSPRVVQNSPNSVYFYPQAASYRPLLSPLRLRQTRTGSASNLELRVTGQGFELATYCARPQRKVYVCRRNSLSDVRHRMTDDDRRMGVLIRAKFCLDAGIPEVKAGLAKLYPALPTPVLGE